jgi:hypothetical protein
MGGMHAWIFYLISTVLLQQRKKICRDSSLRQKQFMQTSLVFKAQDAANLKQNKIDKQEEHD